MSPEACERLFSLATLTQFPHIVRTSVLHICVRLVLAGTPYAGGQFRVQLTLPKDFPSNPPKAYFLTKIFHPNVASNGEICVNTLKKDWKPNLGIKHILLVSEINCLLTLWMMRTRLAF